MLVLMTGVRVGGAWRRSSLGAHCLCPWLCSGLCAAEGRQKPVRVAEEWCGAGTGTCTTLADAPPYASSAFLNCSRCTQAGHMPAVCSALACLTQQPYSTAAPCLPVGHVCKHQ